MFGWKYNESMVRTYMVDHAEDMGRFWAEVFLRTPQIYQDFMRGYIDKMQEGTLNKKE